MSDKWPEKIVIGLTGNIATGKSAVMRFAAEHGALTIDADKVVHHVLNTNQAVQIKIVETFGDSVKAPNGSVDRAALGRIVFNDPQKLNQLEALVHPEVRPLIEQQIEQSNARVIMIEAIKLLEGDLVDYCDKVWVTNCGKFLQLQRLIIARGMDEEAAFARIVAQEAQDEKLARADVVIDTSGPLTETRKQVVAAWQTLSSEDVVAEEAPEVPEAAPEEAPEEAAPALEEETAPAAEPAADSDVVVRRARPSDIPSIMLLIHKATDGKVKPKRAEILMSLSERGYLIGQVDSEISTVVGWYADKGFASIEQIYSHPPEATQLTGKAVVAEINRSANELMCEAVFAFLPAEDQPAHVVQMLKELEYQDDSDRENWPRVWKQALAEEQPENTSVMVRKLWNARVA